jgi:hypothetical protein
MTREEAIDIIKCLAWYTRPDEDIEQAIKSLEQELCEDAISRQTVIDLMMQKWGENFSGDDAMQESIDAIRDMPSVTPQKPRKGEWLRMSDLSEQEDDRYKCSRCGNVIHHKNKMNLYAFNSWCGRCGSDNGRHTNYEGKEND